MQTSVTFKKPTFNHKEGDLAEAIGIKPNPDLNTAEGRGMAVVNSLSSLLYLIFEFGIPEELEDKNIEDVTDPEDKEILIVRGIITRNKGILRGRPSEMIEKVYDQMTDEEKEIFIQADRQRRGNNGTDSKD